MKKLCLIPLSLFLLSYVAKSTTDKYRLSYRDSPSTSIVIGFNVVNGTNHTVYYGKTKEGVQLQNYESSRTVDRQVNYKGMNNNFVRLSGLSPGTTYYFVVADNNSISEVMYFQTISDDPDATISFIAGGDSRKSSSLADDDAILWANEMVTKLKPDAVLFGGDMTDGDTNNEWIEFFNQWQTIIDSDGRVTPICATQGNHEANPAVIVNLFDVPDQDDNLVGNQAYYALTFGNNLARVYTLNSDETGIITDQADWLESDLQNNTSTIWKMAQYHQPIIPHQSSKSDRSDLYDNWAQHFYNYGVRVAIECDAHVVKETKPVKPTGDLGDAEDGFTHDPDRGTVYIGEGTWRALRPNNDDHPFTLSSGSFNQVKWLIINKSQIELRTVKTININSVSEVSNNDRFTPPAGLDVWENRVTIITNSNTSPPITTITSPADNTEFPTTGIVSINVDAFDTDGTITKVEYEIDGTLEGATFGGPHSFDFNFTEEGDHIIKVIAYDNDGLTGSDQISIYVGDRPQVIITQINSKSNDAEERDGIMDIVSSDLELTEDNGIQLVGLRFSNVVIPDDVRITAAHLEFNVDAPSSVATDLIIHGIANAHVGGFSESNTLSTQPTTSQFKEWAPPAWTTIGEWKESPDLMVIINELFSSPDWASGRNISFIISGTGKREACSFDKSPALAPKLVLEYEYITLASMPDISESTLQIFPNPFQEMLHITKNESDISKLQVINQQGEIIFEDELVDGKNIQTNTWKPGAYFIRIEKEDAIINRKIIKSN